MRERGDASGPRRPRREGGSRAPSGEQAGGDGDRAADGGVSLLVRVEHAADPVRGRDDARREVGDGLRLLGRDGRLVLRVERARVRALDGEPPLDPRRDLDEPARRLAAELLEPGAVLGDEVDREAVATRGVRIPSQTIGFPRSSSQW
jgi:hypothetical protein